jgi:hypothetical protein
MDPQIQHYGFSIIWIYFSSLFVFLFGIWEIRIVSKSLLISEIKCFYLYLWHSLFTVAHYLWVANAGGADSDITGTYINSLNIGFSSPYLATLFITKFYSFWSYFLRFSFFTTFLVVNIIGTNGLMIIEYFHKKYSNIFPKFLKNVSSLFIWLPALNFWTCIGKDSLMFIGILLITFSLERLNKRSYLLVPALLIATFIRSYVTIILVVSILLSISSSKGEFNNTKKILLFFLALISSYFIVPLANDYLFGGNFQDITYQGTYTVDPNSNPIWKIFSYNFRPIFYDAYSLIGFFLSIDSLILLSIFSYFIILSIKIRRIFFIFSNQFLIFCSSSTIIIGLSLSLTTSNLGLASRHKWMFLPVAFIGFMKLFFDYYRNKIKE